MAVRVVGVFEQTLDGARCRPLGRSRSACRYADGAGGVASLVLDLRRGRFGLAPGKRVSLAGLANPVELALRIGDDGGPELLLMAERPGRWPYRR